MTDQVIQVLMQLPVVFIFIWYVDRSTKIHNDTLQKKDDALQKFLTEERAARKDMQECLAAELRQTNELMGQFRNEVNSAISVMKDRTRRSGDKEL